MASSTNSNSYLPDSPPPWLAEPGMGLTLGEATVVLGPLLRTTVGSSDLVGERICNDSRLLQPGDIFVALTERRDGHIYVGDAFERGASFAIVSQWPLPIELAPAQGVLVVRDVDAALVTLARWWRQRYPIPAVGIGGGVGKTTTKEVTASLLAQRYGSNSVLKTPANWNDARGVSLTILGLRSHHQRAVFELGMDRPGEVAQLAEIAQPQWGIVTSVSATHLEFFPSMDELIATERGMVESLPSDGLAILNDNDRLVRNMIPFATAPTFTFGTIPGVNLIAFSIQNQGTSGLKFTARCGDEEADIQSNLIGRHLITNALASLSVAIADGWTLAEASSALSQIIVPQRIRFIDGLNNSTIIDDTYNASPQSMRAALDLLRDWPQEEGGRRFALLGTMRELGPRSWREHHRLGRYASSRCSILWVTGDEREAIVAGARAGGLEDVRVFADPSEAATNCAALLHPHDVLLVKASHAVGLGHVISILRG
jgi:UDP-N-acetylmuramoyl-tripeptide--D-alanyl-D-alanine ligase